MRWLVSTVLDIINKIVVEAIFPIRKKSYAEYCIIEQLYSTSNIFHVIVSIIYKSAFINIKPQLKKSSLIPYL